MIKNIKIIISHYIKIWIKTWTCNHAFYCANLNDDQIRESGYMLMECSKCGYIKKQKYTGEV